MAKSNRVDLVDGPVAPGILRFVLPLLAAGLLQVAFNAADSMVVGRFVGDSALAAVASTVSAVSLLVNAAVSLSSGVNVVTARATGRGDGEQISRAVHTAICLALWCGGLIMALGLAFSPTLLAWMGSPDGVREQSALYLRIYSLGIPATLLYNFGSAVLRGVGDTRRPTAYLMLAGALNVALNLLLVIAFRLEVAGVAIATAASNWVSAGLVLRALVREQGPTRLDRRRIGIHRDTLRAVARVGLPACASSVIIALSNVLVQSSVNSLGEAAMAGNGAWSNIEAFLFTADNSFFQTAINFAGANLGARKPERMDAARRWLILMTAVCIAALGGAAVLFGRPLLRIFIRGEEAIGIGLLRIRVSALPLTFIAVGDAWSGSMRGMGHSLAPSLGYIFTLCLFRFLWLATVFRAHHTALALFLIYPTSWLVSMICNGCLLFFIRRREFARIRRELAEEKQEETGVR